MTPLATARAKPGHDALARLTFNCPLSSPRGYGLIEELGLTHGARVGDLGCGWAELLLRALERVPGTTGEGVDLDAAALERGRRNALERGLAARVQLERGDAGAWTARIGAFDALLCLGASHALGGTEPALIALRRMLRQDGRALLGEGFWTVPPTPGALAALGVEPEALTDLPGLIARAEAAGLRVVSADAATQDEWDEFNVLARSGERDDAYQDGYRGVLGFACLVLAAA